MPTYARLATLQAQIHKHAVVCLTAYLPDVMLSAATDLLFASSISAPKHRLGYGDDAHKATMQRREYA